MFVKHIKLEKGYKLKHNCIVFYWLYLKIFIAQLIYSAVMY